jgi:hypothetical protein
LWKLVSWVISLFSHIILSRPKNMSPPIPISPLSPKLNQWLGLHLSHQLCIESREIVERWAVCRSRISLVRRWMCMVEYWVQAPWI